MALFDGDGGSLSVTLDGPFGSVGAPTKLTEVALPASNWKGAESPYSQVVAVEGVSAGSMVNLQLSPWQLEQLRGMELAFTTENDGGTVTVFAIGDRPDGDFVLQASIVEVTV